MARGRTKPTTQTALREAGSDTTIIGSDDLTDRLVEEYHTALEARMAATTEEVATKTKLLERFDKLGIGPDKQNGPEYVTAPGRKIRVSIAKRKLKFVKAKGADDDEEEAEGETDAANG